jgi:predicted amidohydrolase YtcJ
MRYCSYTKPLAIIKNRMQHIIRYSIMLNKILDFKIFAILTVVFLINSCSSEVEKDMKLFHSGTILKVDKEFSEVEAVVIQKNKIIATGDYEALNDEYGNRSEQIDLKGSTMLPGFIDAHAHVVSGSAVNYLMDYVGMSRFATTDEVFNYLTKKAKNTAEGEWITARNWDPAIQGGQEMLTFEELDAISTEHPVFILNASGHWAYANTKAFEVAGITETIENPSGAEFVRDENGQLVGAMKNMLSFIKVWGANPKLKTMDPVKALNSLLNDWNSEGITTTTELALGVSTNSPEDATILFDAAKRTDFTARVRAYASYAINDQWDKVELKANQGNEYARIVGFKLVADGSNQGFTGLQREHYCCGLHQGSTGQEYTSVEALTKYAKQRSTQGFQLAIHGNGDKGIDNILTVMENLQNEGYDLKSLRPRIEHASILHDEQIEKMKKHSFSASLLIGHVYYWGEFMRDNVFGEEKLQLLDRAASLEKQNISYTLHSDFMVTNPDPLEMISIAVNRNTWKDKDYIIGPNEAVSVESAIRALTSEAAWQVMSEHEIGSIEPEKFADFVILESDPRKVDKENISKIEVLETWMDGKKVYSK